SRRRHTRFSRDWSSDVCSSDLDLVAVGQQRELTGIAAGQPLPGVEDAVVHLADHGTEIERVAEQRRAVALHVCTVDAQQGMAEQIGRASCRERGDVWVVDGSGK